MMDCFTRGIGLGSAALGAGKLCSRSGAAVVSVPLPLGACREVGVGESRSVNQRRASLLFWEREP